jgi:hypothetical protein
MYCARMSLLASRRSLMNFRDYTNPLLEISRAIWACCGDLWIHQLPGFKIAAGYSRQFQRALLPAIFLSNKKGK